MLNLTKPFIISLLGLALIQSCSSSINNHSNEGDEREELRSRIALFNSAFQNGEIEQLELMITDHYLHTNGGSQSIRKKDWMAYLKKRKEEISSGDLVVDNYKMDEVQMEFYQDLAIVTAKISFTSTRNGEGKENEMRVTNVWIKEEGVWKRAAFHDTRIE